MTAFPLPARDALKSLLVHVDASPRSAERLGLAQRLAHHHQAELHAVYAVLPSLLGTPWFNAEATAEMAAMLADLDEEMRQRAQGMAKAAQAHGPLIWQELSGAGLQAALTERALLADLLLLGQPDPDDTRSGLLPAGLLPALAVDSGRPTLMVPRSGSFEAQMELVALAWKPSREAARALHAALPWLREAGEIHLLQADTEPAEAEARGEAVRHWLRLHGVGGWVESECLQARGQEVGEALLDRAELRQAQLLVMGCYGHGRAREWVLGGVTEHVIGRARLPVLFVH